MALRGAMLDAKASEISSIPIELTIREKNLKIKLAHL